MTAPSKSSISTARSRKWISRTGRRSGRTAGWKPLKLPRTGAAPAMSSPPAARAAGPGRAEDGGLEAAEAPEDWSGSVDVEPTDDEGRGSESREDRELRAGSLDGIDLF